MPDVPIEVPQPLDLPLAPDLGPLAAAGPPIVPEQAPIPAVPAFRSPGALQAAEVQQPMNPPMAPGMAPEPVPPGPAPGLVDPAEAAPDPAADILAEPDIWFPDEEAKTPAQQQYEERLSQLQARQTMGEAALQRETLRDVQQARQTRERERAQEQEAIAAAQKGADEERARYKRLAMRGKPPMNDTQKASTVMLALAGLVSKNPGQYQQQIQNLVEQSARDWETSMAQHRDLVGQAQDEVTRAQQASREAEHAAQAVIANLYGELAEKADLLRAQTKGAVAQANYEMAGEFFRQRQEQAAAAAAKERLGLQLEATKVGIDIEKVQERSREAARERELKDVMQRRELALRRRGQDISLAKERAAREREQEKMVRTGTLVDPGKGGLRRGMFVSRFADDPKQMIKDQERVNDFEDAQRSYMEYHALIRKVAGRGRMYQGAGGDRLRDDDEKMLRAKRVELLEQTTKAMTGASATPEQMAHFDLMVPNVKSYSDAGTWDAVKFSRKYFDRLANEMESFLVSRAPAGMTREQVVAQSPSRRWRAVAEEPVATPESRVTEALLRRAPQDRYATLTNFARGLQAGRFTRDEADSIISSVYQISQAEGIPERDKRLYRKVARNLIKREGTFKYSDKPGTLDRVLQLAARTAAGERDVRGKLRKEEAEQKERRELEELWRARGR